MTDKSRQPEDRDRSSMMKGVSSSNPQMQAAGLMPHPFGMPPESSLGLTTHHPLAYGMMQPLAMGRVTQNVSNDMGPPIFMPSLNLGVPRQPTSSMNQPSKHPKNSLAQPSIMANSFMPEVMTFPPPHQPIMFAPHQVRQPGQPAYLSPGSPVNMKLSSSKAGPVKLHVTKSQNVVRPTPKQPSSLPPTSHTKPTNATISRPKGDSPVELTYVHSPQGSYVLAAHPMVSQKGSTLSKMLMTPAQQQQQTSTVSSTGGQPQQKDMAEIGGAYVSHNTTPKPAVPALTSLAAESHAGKVGGLTSAGPDGYLGRLSEHVTTSGQPTSMASFTNTKTERPPQPAAPNSPSSQPFSQTGVANKDKSNIIIRGSTLTGRHIAAITNNTTLQYTSSSAMQPAYTQGSIPQTVDSVKSEYGPADTGWPHPPPDHASDPGMFGNQVIQQSGKSGQSSGGVSVPTVTAPGVLGLSTQTHSPGGSNLLGSPVRHAGIPHSQGLSSSPRPQILRKRPLDGSVAQGEVPPVPLSPTSDMGSHNHVGGRPEISDVSASPRKKPRKQNMVANDDLYASNVPDSLSSSSASSLDTPLSVEGSEESGRSLATSGSTKSSRVKKETSKDGGAAEVEIRYLSQLRRCPYPISSVHKVYHKAPHNHFKQHSDIKHRDDPCQSAVQIASDRYVQQRAKGWRVHHVLKQIEEMSLVEQEMRDTIESLRSLADDMKTSDKCVIEDEYIDNFTELIECNTVRSNRILSHMENTKRQSFKILEHCPTVTQLLDKCSPPTSLPSPLLNHHKARS